MKLYFIGWHGTARVNAINAKTLNEAKKQFALSEKVDFQYTEGYMKQTKEPFYSQVN